MASMWARAVSAATWPPGWVGPLWIERQQAVGSRPAENVAQRNWTTAGNLDSTEQAIVDRCGLLTPWANGWSLDWWIGAEDHWHFPSREAAVRQTLLERTPVVQTAMHVPGGDMIHRVYAVSGDSSYGDLVVVEVDNQSALPVAVGLAVRPVNSEGPAPITRISAPAGGPVLVDGWVALVLPRPPAFAAFGCAADGDAAERLADLQLIDGSVSGVRCPAGLANAVFVYPLAHRAVLRVAVPFEAKRRRRHRARSAPGFPPLASATAVARGWGVQTRRGMGLVLPEGRLADAVEANRRALLLCHRAAERPSMALGGAIDVGCSLDRYGFHAEADRVMRSWLDRRRVNGAFRGPDECSATGQALHAMADHWRVTRDADFRAAMEAIVGLSGHWLSRRQDTSLWSRLGQRGAEELQAGPAVPAAAVGASSAIRADQPSAPGVDSPDALAALAPSVALGLVAAEDRWISAAVEAFRHRCVQDDGACVAGDAAGLSPALTARLARLEVCRGERVALRRLQWLIEVASSTFTWPEVVDRRTGGGCAGDGDDLLTRSAFLTLMRDLLVRETAVPGLGPGLALCSMLPDRWVGQPLEVRDAPSALGTISFALRWHGSRPALLWHLDPHKGVTDIRLTAPGLDPAWSSDEVRGEALFGLAGVRHR